MKKILTALLFVFIIFSYTNAQKFNLSYGPVLGLNTSFMDSKASVDYNYPFNELDRDISLSTSGKSSLGYQAGIFVKLQPVNSRFSFDVSMLIASVNNNYSLTFYREAYYSTPWTTPVDRWMPETETENLQNEFTNLIIPVKVGYDFLKFEKFNLAILGGVAANIVLKDDHVKIDINFDENHLYKDYFLSYQAGVKAEFEKIICMLSYDRSLNMQQAASRDYFPWQMKVEKLYLNSFSFSVAYKLR